jgi:hypothetical protein
MSKMDLVAPPVTYLPVWNQETQQYEDYEPFEANRPGNYHVCNCQNRKSMFQNMSQHKIHIKNKGHKLWVQTFEGLHSHEEVKRLISELAQIKRELAIAQAEIEKQSAQVKRERQRGNRYKVKYETLQAGERIMVNELD